MFLEEAKALIHHTATVSYRLRMAKRGETGTVKVGVGLYLGDKVGSVAAEHARVHPEVDLQCQAIFSTQQNQALREGKIDVGFLRPPIDPGLCSDMLYEERLVVLVSRSNLLAKRKSVRVKDLACETLFLPDRSVGSGLRDKVLDLYAKAGFSPRINPMSADPAPSNEVHKVLLAVNKGIFILADEIGARADSSHVAVAIPLEEPDARIGLYVAWRKGESSPSVLNRLDTARRVLGTKLPMSTSRIATTRIAASA